MGSVGRAMGRWVGAAGLVALALVAGCDKGDGKRPVFPVTGKITVDGKPATDAYLVFHPTDSADSTAPKPSAVADAQGNLVFTTYRTGDGLPAGEYKVGIQWPKMANQFGRVQPSGDQLGGKFKDPAMSKWTVRIKEGPNTLPDFDVKTK